MFVLEHMDCFICRVTERIVRVMWILAIFAVLDSADAQDRSTYLDLITALNFLVTSAVSIMAI